MAHEICDDDSVCDLPVRYAMRSMVFLEDTFVHLRQMLWYDTEAIDMIDELLTQAKDDILRHHIEDKHCRRVALIALTRAGAHLTRQRERVVAEYLSDGERVDVIPSKHNVMHAIACEQFIMTAMSQLLAEDK